MAASTPPPPERVSTPPTPLHGPRYDVYEPFSPRRSARVSSLRTSRDVAGSSRHSFSQTQSTTTTTQQRPHFSLTATPRKSTLARTASSQTLSPPSSPDTELRHPAPARPTPVRRSLFTSLAHDHTTSDSDSLTLTPQTMLPTPSKTPRKRAPAAMASTARILNFKPASLDDVMPTPRKQRKTRLDLYDDPSHDQDKIQVFTDTKDRVPDVDTADDNPFVGPRKKQSRTAKQKAAEKDGNEADMDDAVRNDEGILYVFRGRKIFRRFESPSGQHEEDDGQDAAVSDTANLKRKAGAVASRPFTRSSLKPRLLFPTEEQIHERLADPHDDEEAVTDIEEERLPRPTPKIARDLVTPAKTISFTPATPPSSHRAVRSASKKMHFLAGAESAQKETGDDEPSAATPVPQKKAKPISPFDAWQRTKAGVGERSKSKKRNISPVPEDASISKRTRSNDVSAEHD
ncbi:hypothetical protein MBLNU459_g2940t1 [Dothideomycetes sp. NU459]